MDSWMDSSVLVEAVNGFLYHRAESERTSKVRDGYRNVLREWLLAEGREDENGHRYLDLDKHLTIGGKTYSAICAQRRLSSSIDLDAVEEYARENGLLDEIFPVVPQRQFDEDRLYALNQQGVVPDEVLDGFITETETFAIVPVKS